MGAPDENAALESPDPTCEVCGRQVPRVEYDAGRRLLICPHCRSLAKGGPGRASDHIRPGRGRTSGRSS